MYKLQETELSISLEGDGAAALERQAERYASIFKLLQRLDTEGGGPANITAVTMLGLMDGYVFNPKSLKSITK